MTAPGKTLSELAQHVGGRVIGDGLVVIRKVGSIEEAGPGEITFLANPRYQPLLAQCKASAVIVGPGAALAILEPHRGYLEAPDPYLAFAKVLQLLTPPTVYSEIISSRAHIDPEAFLEDSVTVFPQVFVDKGAHVGARSVLYPGVFLGERVQIGQDCVLHPNVVVRDGCRIGNRVVLHAGVVIGSDGFGYAGEGEGRVKIPQVGIVELDDDIEIGANSTVDRATLGRTFIGRGVKIDNLVQIAHNVSIGRHCLIASQSGISGSSQVGDFVMMGGQVGLADHISVGTGAMLGAQSGHMSDVPAGASWVGTPAQPVRDFMKGVAVLRRLVRSAGKPEREGA